LIKYWRSIRDIETIQTSGRGRLPKACFSLEAGRLAVPYEIVGTPGHNPPNWDRPAQRGTSGHLKHTIFILKICDMFTYKLTNRMHQSEDRIELTLIDFAPIFSVEGVRISSSASLPDLPFGPLGEEGLRHRIFPHKYFQCQLPLLQLVEGGLQHLALQMMTWWFLTFMAPAIKQKVQSLPGIEYLYSVIHPSQLEIPAFITEHDMTEMLLEK
ncbi:unnamed protein product, partial [Nesidiocoris tenuis]